VHHRHLALAIVLALSGCAVDSSGGVVEPSFDGKSDIYTDLARAGAIDYGQRVTGTFDRDFQFHAYKFSAVEGAEVSAEVTQLGSSRGLDTTLFLYELHGSAHPTRLASDDDDGWGALSAIEAFELHEDGTYALIVGTKDGAGRGNFGFELRCDNGACAPAEPACPVDEQRAIAECVDTNTSEYGFEAELHEVAADACEGGGPDPDCQLWTQRAYPPTADRTVGFLQPVSEAAIDALVDRVSRSEVCGHGPDYGCEFRIAAYDYDSDSSITIEELMAHARLSAPPGPGVFAIQQTGESAEEAYRGFASRMGIAEDMPEIIDLIGATPENAVYGSYAGDDIQWNYGDCSGETVVMDFPDEGNAIEISVFYCWG
jgi:hypothetical protein